ncbi:MAG: TldD/PmbA family protein [Candidatus Njordarchaeia archaeon]
MVTVNELIEIGSKFIKRTRDLGADELEIYLESRRNFSLRVINRYTTIREGIDAGVGIRALVGKSIGFVSESTLNEESILEAIKVAIKIAKNKPEDPGLSHLPEPSKEYTAKGIFDKNLIEYHSDAFANMVRDSIAHAYDSCQLIKKVDFGFNRSIIKYAIVNSNGIQIGDKATVLSAYTDINVKKDDEEVTGVAFEVSRSIHERKILNLGVQAVRNAVSMFGGKKLKEAITADAVIENQCVPDFLWPIQYNVNAQNVQNHRSKFIGKINEKVASEILTLVDDGTLPEGIRTVKSDGEGIATRRKTIIEKGVLRSFIYDSYTAHKENKESTGNAQRGSFERPPRISFVNAVIEHGKGTLDDLVRETEKGVLIRGYMMGAHLTDPLKGTFAMTNINAQYIEHGEVKYPLKSITVSGNFFDLLHKIYRVANDPKILPEGKYVSMIVKDLSFV